ncbi:hypothetical protein AB0L06_20285 [Spirillospora sp. NPDC052269]
MALKPAFVEFATCTPPCTHNAVLQVGDVPSLTSPGLLGAGQSVRVEFQVDEAPDGSSDDVPDEATLKIRAVVEKDGSRPGFAPLDVLVNGEPLVSRFRLPGGREVPQMLPVAIPGDTLRGGTNVLELRVGEDARAGLSLIALLIEDVRHPGAAERLYWGDPTVHAFEFATRIRPKDGEWSPGPPLRFYFDTGMKPRPSTLEWHHWDGGRTGILFTPNMDKFFGGGQRADSGEPFEVRGEQRDQRAEPHGEPQRFVTRYSQRMAWRDLQESGGEFRFLLDDGSGPIKRVKWHDRAGGEGAIQFTRDGRSFSGFQRRPDEGWESFEGIPEDDPRLTEPPPEPVDVRQALQDFAESAADRLNTWLRKL